MSNKDFQPEKAQPNADLPSSNQPSSDQPKMGMVVNGEGVSFSRDALLASMGGWLGIVESVLPGIVFMLLFTITKAAVLSIAIASMLSVGFILYRLSKKGKASQALVGALFIALSAFLVLRDGGAAKDYFIPGILINVSYGAVMLLSVLVRWPVIGVMVGLLTSSGTAWRRDKAKMKIYGWASIVWVILFSVRLIIELPLYFTGQLEALATAKLVLGYPAYALTAWVTWLMVRRTFVKSV